MSVTVATWIAGRRPAAAMPLDRWIGGEHQEETEALLPAITGLARSALESALALPGQREGAFHLLAADALFTYACEAALEAEDAEETLRLVLRSASER